MGSEPSVSGFALLLRRLRTSAGLTQEELAESAGLSARTISDLERGISVTARASTARLLASALELSRSERTEFLAEASKTPSSAVLTAPARSSLNLGLSSTGRCPGTSPRSPAGLQNSSGRYGRSLTRAPTAA